jgi:hypothetical protein
MDKKAINAARIEYTRAAESLEVVATTNDFLTLEKHWASLLVSAGRWYRRSMELTASNMATWTHAMTRSAWGGSMRCLLMRATAFSFQSVITSAEAGLLNPISITMGAIQCNFDIDSSSSGRTEA